MDSTPSHVAVATRDTVTLIRSAIHGLLGAADARRESELRAVLVRDDDYGSRGKPVDWDDAAELLAAMPGQDLQEGDDGEFRIARRVARDRIISTVDSDARHGHKTSAL